MAKPTRALPSIDRVGEDTPLRLDAAASIAFPDGGMTAKGLRREAERGRLAIERVAGKDYTTLAYIKRMRELCRLADKVQDSTYVPSAETHAGASPIPPPGASSMDDISAAQAAARMIVKELKALSATTSPKSISPRPATGSVIRLASRSRT